MITQARLKELIHYNPVTGEIHRIAHVNGAIRKTPKRVEPKVRIDGYLPLYIGGERSYYHRFVFLYMTGRWPNEIDHIDQDKTNNRWDNLREVNRSENKKNTPLQANNTSGICGIRWYKNSGQWVSGEGKWVASIRSNGKSKTLGYYEEIWDAICARKSAEYKHGFHPNHGN